MKVPIKHAIDTEAWFNCCCFGNGDGFDEETKQISFRIKVLSMSLVNIYKEIDEPERLKIDNGLLYLLAIEVVNLNKKPVDRQTIKKSIVLLDQDNFSFQALNDHHLNSSSKFAVVKGLNRFDKFDYDALQPKLKISGALAFLLPDDPTAEYFLSIQEGSITAV